MRGDFSNLVKIFSYPSNSRDPTNRPARLVATQHPQTTNPKPEIQSYNWDVDLIPLASKKELKESYGHPWIKSRKCYLLEGSLYKYENLKRGFPLGVPKIHSFFQTLIKPTSTLGPPQPTQRFSLPHHRSKTTRSQLSLSNYLPIFCFNFSLCLTSFIFFFVVAGLN